MQITPTSRFIAKAETIYLGDNGRASCGAHLGYTAKATGRDLSGQRIMAVTPEAARLAKTEFGYIPECEECGRKASFLA